MVLRLEDRKARGARLGAVQVALALALAVSWASSVTAGSDASDASERKTDEAAGGAAGFRFKPVADTSLAVCEGERTVFVYNHGVMRKTGVPESYNRSSYVHPIYGLDGEVLTDDFPKDHYHHRGLFWGWPHVRIDGEEYNSWSPSGIQIKFERWTRRQAGPEVAILGVENGWYVGDEKVVEEDLRLVLHRATPKGRALDVELTWKATQKPVTLQGAAEKSYGGLTLRLAPRENTAITVPEGRTKEDLAVTRLPWADLTGKMEGARERSGIAILIAKTHPDYPPTWLTRHYGALCVGWPGVKPGTLEPGKPVRCEYRLWIHRSDVDAAELSRVYQEYLESREKKP